ncbi:GntR family transcriptional regulator [Paracoccaceae bacterium GXU_MW_L88]
MIDTVPAHERVYRALRARVMHGEIAPGAQLTLRGIAEDFGTSMTPAREAVRRLVAEGGLTMTQSGRVSAPDLTNERIEELAAIRALLEPELAIRAMPRAHFALLERMEMMNDSIERTVATGDAGGYVRGNLDFHRALYLRAQAPAMLAMVETVWLQLGPTMRALYEKLRRDQLGRNHRLIIAALKSGDEASLRLAMRADVTAGLRMLATES